MKKKIILLLTGLFFGVSLYAQEVVFDPQNFESVVSNGVVRSAAESTHDQYLGKINTNVNNLNINVGSVVAAQTMIYNALSNVNSALIDGLEVKNMAFIIADMINYINQALTMAKAQPYLLLFGENMAREMRTRSMALVTDVSGFVLKEGNNVLADYNARDELLRKVMTQLQILDGLAYGAYRAMYWAKQRGMIASLNPFEDYINKDKIFVAQIIQNAKYLKQ